MSTLSRFEIHQPASALEASQMLSHYGEDAGIYAGGTELLLAMSHQALRYRHLIDLKVVPGLDSIEVRDGFIEIGATSTHRSIERSPLVRQNQPALADMESHVANVRVRATGTLGGNLCFAEPHSDPATLLLVLGASVAVEGPQRRREIPMHDFFIGPYETRLAPTEVMTGVQIPVAAGEWRSAYVKFQVHERPMLGLALALETADNGETFSRARVAVGCVSPCPRRSAAAENLLTGPRSEIEPNLPLAAEALAEAADVIDDQQGSAEYKRHLIQVFLRRAFARALGA